MESTIATSPAHLDWHRCHAEHDEWVRTVRDPAMKASEGVRTIRTKNAHAEYEIAPLPDGRYALTFSLHYDCGNCHGSSTPWVAYSSRQECVAVFLRRAREHFGAEISSSVEPDESDPDDDSTAGCRTQREARKAMLAQLDSGGLFGFVEPDPVPPSPISFPPLP